MKRILSVFVLAAMTLVGCSTFSPWTKIQKVDYMSTSLGFKASVPVGWMKSNFSKGLMLTYDGPMLNTINVDCVRFDAQMKDTKRKFTVEMNPQELAETQIDMLKANPGSTDVKIGENKPITVSGRQSFMFDYSFRNKDGLQYKGRVIGLLHAKGVYRIYYEAPAQYYFDRNIADFEKFIQSFELIEKN